MNKIILGVLWAVIITTFGYGIHNGMIYNIPSAFQVAAVKKAPSIAVAQLPWLTTPPPPSTGRQDIGVILVNFNDSPAPSQYFNPNSMNALLFGPNSDFKHFYQRNSYGKVSVNGKTFGPYTLNKSGVVSCYTYDGKKLGNLTQLVTYRDISQIITEYNIPLQNYNRILVVANNIPSECNTGGQGDMGNVHQGGDITRVAWVSAHNLHSHTASPSFSAFEFIVAHELGHNMGLNHAAFMGECRTSRFLEVAVNPCKRIEYGNKNDVMGNYQYSSDFNVAAKEYLGWLDSKSITTISKSGRYTIRNLQSTSGVRGAKIRIGQWSNIEYYLYFEYRPNATDFLDRQGVMVYLVEKDATRKSPQTTLIDMNIQLSGVTALTKHTSAYTLTEQMPGLKIGPIISGNNNQITFDVTVPN